MDSRPKILVDLNVILDVLQCRAPFYDDSARVLACAETGRIEGLVAAHSLTTLFYLLARYESADKARLVLGQILSFLAVAAVDARVIELALQAPYADFEDAVQMMAAVQAGAEALVTRNPQDYRSGPLPALIPSELAAIL